MSSSEGSFIPSTTTTTENKETEQTEEETHINGELVYVALPRDLRHRFAPLFVADSGGGTAEHGNGVDALHGGRVPAGQRDQPAHPSHHEVHKLRCAPEEHCPLLSPRRLLLQLPAWRSGQPLQPWLQRHHQVQKLNYYSLFFLFFFNIWYSRFAVHMVMIFNVCLLLCIVLLPINNYYECHSFIIILLLLITIYFLCYRPLVFSFFISQNN